MKNFTRILFTSLAVLPITLLAQTAYTFDASGNGAYDGTTYKNMVQYPEVLASGTFGLTDVAELGLSFSDGNTSKLFRGLTRSVNTCSVDLTAIPSCKDQQVVWTQYILTETTSPAKNGVVLRAQDSPAGYSSDVRQGYYFWAQNTGVAGQVRFRIRNLLPSGDGTTIGDATVDIPGYTTNPLYLKAQAQGSSLSFWYSLDNATWTLVNNSVYTDATYTEGTVQIAWGVGAGSNMDVYFDNVTFTVPSSSSLNKGLADRDLHVVADGSSVTVNNAKYFSVHNLTGAKVNETRSTESSNTITLKKGVYIVKSGNSVEKVIVK